MVEELFSSAAKRWFRNCVSDFAKKIGSYSKDLLIALHAENF
jgi:hypothetical protein